MLSTVGRNLNWISLGMNIFLILLMGTVGFMAHDIYAEIRAYPNTTIKQDMQRLNAKLKGTVDREDYAGLCSIVEQKADKETMNRIDRNIQKRLDLLVDEIRALRTDLSRYFYKSRDSTHDSSIKLLPYIQEDVAWASIQDN